MAYTKDAAALNELRRRGPGQEEDQRSQGCCGDTGTSDLDHLDARGVVDLLDPCLI